MKNKMKELLKPQVWQIKLMAGLVVIALFVHYCFMFWSLYRFQSPILIEIQSPIRSRFISPVPDGVIATPINDNDEPSEWVDPITNEVITPPVTPTPKKKAHVIDLVRDVEAAETDQVTVQDSDQVKQYIEEKFGKDAPFALKMAFCESGIQAYNWHNKFLGVTAEEADERMSAVGVFMIYRKAHPEHSFADLLNYKYNVDVAYKMFSEQGTTPWNASKSCWNK